MVLGMSFVPLIVDWISGGLPRMKSEGKFIARIDNKETNCKSPNVHFFFGYFVFVYEAYHTRKKQESFPAENRNRRTARGITCPSVTCPAGGRGTPALDVYAHT